MIELTGIVDAESSGLLRKDLGWDHESQPHLLELACKVVDGKRRTVSRFSRVVRPEGWSIEYGAEDVHGITEAYAAQVGAPLPLVLAELKMSLEGVTRLVGHGLSGFDFPLISLSLRRASAENLWFSRLSGRIYDTAEKAAPIMGLPNPKMPGEAKYPTLEEAAAFFGYSQNWVSSHRAYEDVLATEAVYYGILNHEHGLSHPAPRDGIRTFVRPETPASP